jgi:hypothetical protein
MMKILISMPPITALQLILIQTIRLQLAARIPPQMVSILMGPKIHPIYLFLSKKIPKNPPKPPKPPHPTQFILVALLYGSLSCFSFIFKFFFFNPISWLNQSLLPCVSINVLMKFYWKFR